MAVEAHARAAGRRIGLDQPGLRHEAAVRVLGVDAHLDRVAVDAHVLLRERQRLAGRDADAGLHDVHARDHLGHRVLHLHAGVHLEHVEVLLPVHQELDRRRSGVLRLPDQLGSAHADGIALGGIDPRGRRLLDELLVTALARAVTLVEVHGVPVLVADGLHLEVARHLQELLDVHPAVAEGRRGLLARGLDAGAQLRLVARDAHAAAAAAGARLHDHGVADLARDLDGLVDVLDGVVGAREDRGARLAREPLAVHLVAERVHRLGARADELEPGVPADLREVRVLAQEAVAGMDRVRVRDLGGGDQAVDPEVGLLRRAGPDADRPVGLLEPGPAPVGGGVDAHRLGAELAAGSDDSQGDLAAVGDQDALEHGWPRAGGRPRVVVAAVSSGGS